MGNESRGRGARRVIADSSAISVSQRERERERNQKRQRMVGKLHKLAKKWKVFVLLLHNSASYLATPPAQPLPYAPMPRLQVGSNQCAIVATRSTIENCRAEKTLFTFSALDKSRRSAGRRGGGREWRGSRRSGNSSAAASRAMFDIRFYSNCHSMLFIFIHSIRFVSFRSFHFKVSEVKFVIEIFRCILWDGA